MSPGFYTLASWYLRPGHEAEFVRRWQDELSVAFRTANPRATGTLVQNLEDPRHFYSFGPWDSEAEMAAARLDPEVRTALNRLRELCESATPAPFRVVLTIG